MDPLGELRAKAVGVLPQVARLQRRLVRELHTLDGTFAPRLDVVVALIARFPDYSLAGARGQLLRSAGLNIGLRTTIQGQIHFVGKPRDVSRIAIGEDCIVEIGRASCRERV